jgi:hypothetical protein
MYTLKNRGSSHMKSFYRFLITSLLVVFITACGGGSTTATTETTSVPVSGLSTTDSTQFLKE